MRWIKEGALDGIKERWIRELQNERFYKRRNRGSDGSGSKERDKEESKDRSIREQAIDGRSDGCLDRGASYGSGSHRMSD